MNGFTQTAMKDLRAFSSCFPSVGFFSSGEEELELEGQPINEGHGSVTTHGNGLNQSGSYGREGPTRRRNFSRPSTEYQLYSSHLDQLKGGGTADITGE